MVTQNKVHFNYAFLILHYQTIELTTNCVKSITECFSDENFIICIVDNASPNGSGKQLKVNYAKSNNIHIIGTDSNIGFAQGNNYGFNYLKSNFEIDFLIVLNNDVIIKDQQFLNKIMQIYERELFDVLGPDIYAPNIEQHQNPQEYKLQNPDCYEYWIDYYSKQLRKEKLKYYLSFPIKSIANIFGKQTKIIKPNNNCNKTDKFEKSIVYNCILYGACFIFSKHYINNRKYAFYPETFMYFEEHILSLQCINEGYKIVYSPELSVEHLCNATTDYIYGTGHKKRWLFYKQAAKSMSIYNKLFKKYQNDSSNTHLTKRTTRLIALIIIFILTASAFISGKIRDGRTPINSDAAGYYCYLPAIFIYGDIHCGFLKQGSELANHYQQEYGYPPEIWFLNNTEKGEITKYSCGTALCELPLFLCACGLSKIFGTECDGYSLIFKLMFILSNLIFSILGIYILYKNLKIHVPDHVAATTAVVIGLCTNLFYYTTTWIGSAHVYNFFFATALLFQWHKFLESPTTKSLTLSALAIGMMVLIRPTDCVFGVFVLLYTVMSGKLPTILKYLKDNIITAIIAVVAFTIPLAIQMVIWKISTGHFIYYSYQDEGFDFMHPHIIDGLFSFKKGWLVYTPVMLLAFVGMAFCQKKYNIPLITTLVIHCYIAFSWWCWWYGGSFGCRVMIVMYPILALPMAKLLERAKTKWAMIAAGLVLAFFMFWNVLQSYQVQKGILHYEDTNWQIYKESLFKIRK